MSTYSHASHRLDKTGFRLRWRAKLEPYPAPIRAAGFTLIELSIVIVIVGLIVGGILVGQDLIKAAQLRSSISVLEKTNAAVNTFRLKYNELPGDMDNAGVMGLGTEGGIGTSGNGDKQIFVDRYWDSTSLAWLQSTEIYNFWYHLSQAELVGEDFTGVTNSGTKPNNLNGYMPKFEFATNDTFVIPGTAIDVNTDENFGNSYILSRFNASDAIIPSSNGFGLSLTAQEAFQIDTKLDDGLPQSGSVQAMYPSSGPYWSGNGLQACNWPWTEYDVLGNRNASTVQSPAQPESIDCSLVIKASW